MRSKCCSRSPGVTSTVRPVGIARTTCATWSTAPSFLHTTLHCPDSLYTLGCAGSVILCRYWLPIPALQSATRSSPSMSERASPSSVCAGVRSMPWVRVDLVLRLLPLVTFPPKGLPPSRSSPAHAMPPKQPHRPSFSPMGIGVPAGPWPHGSVRSPACLLDERGRQERGLEEATAQDSSKTVETAGRNGLWSDLRNDVLPRIGLFDDDGPVPLVIADQKDGQSASFIREKGNKCGSCGQRQPEQVNIGGRGTDGT